MSPPCAAHRRPPSPPFPRWLLLLPEPPKNDDCHFFLHFEYWIFQTLKIESLGQSNSCTHLQHFSMLPKAIFLLWIQRCLINTKHRCDLCRKWTQFYCASYKLTKWAVLASFQVSLYTLLPVVQS
ncbi:hypothetical protein SORBI_3002G181450 [Sorghum bicolor]|uniref:Uncharacterized protein n=1 Tax=Sorghum bicolor TaxID=4558 RepID=A0A1W0W4R6_SORBI|nr:hypothetical protein SORBI_3002G181450 [Sorghum bicolor]